MRRTTFDTLIATAGALMAAVMLVAAGLLLWASLFIGSQVHDQLSAQNIFFPSADSEAVAGPEFAAMREYGGERLTDGAQAETYADDFIGVHLDGIADGKTYAEVSSALQADPENATLQGQADALFKGSTLRGLLLNAYAFGKIGSLSMLASVLAFVAAALFAGFSALGFRHARHTGSETELFGGRAAEPAGV